MTEQAPDVAEVPLTSAAHAALMHLVATDEANAAVNLAVARYRPLTVLLAQALEGWYLDGRPAEQDPTVSRVLNRMRE